MTGVKVGNGVCVSVGVAGVGVLVGVRVQVLLGVGVVVPVQVGVGVLVGVLVFPGVGVAVTLGVQCPDLSPILPSTLIDPLTHQTPLDLHTKIAPSAPIK